MERVSQVHSLTFMEKQFNGSYIHIHIFSGGAQMDLSINKELFNNETFANKTERRGEERGEYH